MTPSRLLPCLILLAAPATCARTQPPETGNKEAAVFCSVLLAEGADYVAAHAAHRRLNQEAVAFVSPEALTAYQLQTAWLDTQAAQMRADLGRIRASFDLEAAPDSRHHFEETSEDGAAARIEFARDCTASLQK